jgi:predicted transcriptional regulator
MSKGNVPCLTAELGRYIQKCVRLRRKLTNGALAQRLGVSKSTVVKYANGSRKGFE